MTIIDNLFPTESSWSQIKTFAEQSIAFSNDVLHLLVGLALQILVAVILRTSLKSPLPWLVVLVVALANEWYDLDAEVWPDRAMQWGEGAKDVLLTLALPTLLLILARYAPGLFGPTVEDGEDTNPDI